MPFTIIDHLIHTEHIPEVGLRSREEEKEKKKQRRREKGKKRMK